MIETTVSAPLSGRAGVAARGALIALAVVGMWFAVFHVSEALIPANYKFDHREASLAATLAFAVPGSLIIAILSARGLRLRRPWLISLVGLALAVILGFSGLVIGGDLPDPFGFILALAFILAAYAGVAAFCGSAARHSQ